jgi:hypothetical protein
MNIQQAKNCNGRVFWKMISMSSALSLWVTISFVTANLGFMYNEVSFRRPSAGKIRQMASLESNDETIATSSISTKRQPSPFDEAAYENDRMKRDAQAMLAMKTEADMEFAKGLRTPWKWKLRKRICTFSSPSPSSYSEFCGC